MDDAAASSPQDETENLLTDADQMALQAAVAILEHPSLPGRLSVLVGHQIDLAESVIPERIMKVANGAASVALRISLRAAVATLPRKMVLPKRFNTAMAAVSGAAGGALGLVTLPIELPISTTIILRSIAEIARDAGEDPREPETALACLEVFALGGGKEAGPASNSGYFAIRAALAKSVQQATRVMLQRGLADEAAPAVVRFIGQIVSRFGIVVGQKIMAQSVPLIGAVAGAAVNTAFAEHYQNLARAHFDVRRLERIYGADVVRREYDRILARGEPAAPRQPALIGAA